MLLPSHRYSNAPYAPGASGDVPAPLSKTPAKLGQRDQLIRRTSPGSGKHGHNITDAARQRSRVTQPIIYHHVHSGQSALTVTSGKSFEAGPPTPIGHRQRHHMISLPPETHPRQGIESGYSGRELGWRRPRRGRGAWTLRNSHSGKWYPFSLSGPRTPHWTGWIREPMTCLTAHQSIAEEPLAFPGYSEL